MLFMEEFSCSERFLSIFTDAAGLNNASVLSLEQSKTDAALGESDMTVIVESAGQKIGLLIENKIDAAAMPEQSARYVMRGQKGIERGDYDKFCIFIIAPEKYLSQNKEAQKYPYRIEYEAVLKYFESINDPRSDFKIQQIKHAIEKQKSGYQVEEDIAVTSFWAEYAKFQKVHYPDVYFIYNSEVKGAKARWPRFNTVIDRLYIHHKTETGTVDLVFDGCADKITSIEKLLAHTVCDYTKEGYIIRPVGRSAAVRLYVPKLDLHRPFDEQQSEVAVGLAAVKKLSDLVKLFDRKDIQDIFSDR